MVTYLVYMLKQTIKFVCHSQFLRYFTMGKDYFEQAKNYVPEIKDMIEPNNLVANI